MKFRKKPVEVDAWQITAEIAQGREVPGYMLDDKIAPYGDYIIIKTLEGSMRGELGDWIIQGVKGEIYPCKPDIFELTYEPVLTPLTK